MIKILISYGENCWADTVPESELEAVKAEALANDCTVRVLGRVSWQAQLAAMENPEL